MKCFDDFLYIVRPEVYLKAIKRGPLKYVPNKWFKNAKPRIVTTFINDQNIVIGKGVGVFTEYENIKREQYLHGIVSIKKLALESEKIIVLDLMHLLTLEELDYIQRVTKLKVVDGKDVRIYFTPYVLKKIYNALEEELIDKELLIISDNSILANRLVVDMSKDMRFLTVFGVNLVEQVELSKIVYDSTGLSIFFTNHIDKILGNYHIIINLSENLNLDLKDLRSRAIVFDLSISKSLSKEISKHNTNAIIVEDFLFTYTYYLYESNFFDANSEIPSHKYGAFQYFNLDDFSKIVSDNVSYTVKEFVENKIRQRIPIKRLDNKK